MEMTIRATVDDCLRALDLYEVPEGCNLSLTDEIDITGQADEDEVVDSATETKRVIEAGGNDLNSLLDKHVVIELAAAIRRGDTREAELMLDRLIDDDFEVSEWVQQGRFSRRARPQTPALAKAA